MLSPALPQCGQIGPLGQRNRSSLLRIPMVESLSLLFANRLTGFLGRFLRTECMDCLRIAFPGLCLQLRDLAPIQKSCLLLNRD